ncbi:LOW QUALITY PROTEIN: uncharacterized protein LOC101756810 [Setaria italica]|nr:LOW QUALITY PROTEIN: uncharacterized protein LOC101756810 [Setaria italica]
MIKSKEEEQLKNIEGRIVANHDFNNDFLQDIGFHNDIYKLLRNIASMQFSLNGPISVYKDVAVEMFMTMKKIMQWSEETNEEIPCLSFRIKDEYCSPNLQSGSKEERDGCGVGAAHYQKRGRRKWSDGGIASFLDKDTERFEHLHEGNSRADMSKLGTSSNRMTRGRRSTSKFLFVHFGHYQRLGPLLCPRWKRALLKIGGSLLAGSASENVDPKMIPLIAREVQAASLRGVQVDRRNLFSGQLLCCGGTWAAETCIERAAACPIGMMASVTNAVLLQASLEKIGIEARVQTTLVMQDATEPYIRRRAMCHLEKGRVVIFGGIGAAMGNPLLTTDSAAALRASEVNADVLLKGLTGESETFLYGWAPGSNGDAESEHISYRKLVARRFSEMDVKAISFCEENNIPFVLFNMLEPGNISRALCGDHVGTLVDQTGRIG